MQMKKSQRLFKITVEYGDGKTRTLDVKATTREVAEQRALKRAPSAVSIHRPTR